MAALGLNVRNVASCRAVSVKARQAPRVAVRPTFKLHARRDQRHVVRAVSEETGEEFYEAVATSGSSEMSLQDLKAALLDSLYGTERGLAARSEVRAEINELISQLEAGNPTPSPTEFIDKLTGDWKLVYTSNSELMAVLALSRLPFVEIGDITQKIDSVSNTVENKVRITVPFTRTSFSTTASFEVRSPKRLQLRLTKGGIHTPELMTDMEIPSNLTVMGQALDLSQLKSVLSPVNERVQGILGQVNNLLSQIPDPQLQIQSDSAQTWQLNTYVDEDTRISRGDGGSVFIYVREISINNQAGYQSGASSGSFDE